MGVAGHGDCYLTTAVQAEAQQGAACNRWKSKAITYVQQHQTANALILTDSVPLCPVVARPGQILEEATVAGMTKAAASATHSGAWRRLLACFLDRA